MPAALCFSKFFSRAILDFWALPPPMSALLIDTKIEDRRLKMITRNPNSPKPIIVIFMFSRDIIGSPVGRSRTNHFCTLLFKGKLHKHTLTFAHTTIKRHFNFYQNYGKIQISEIIGLSHVSARLNSENYNNTIWKKRRRQIYQTISKILIN